ncbi:STAS domain-containing protein [Streptomyces sp. ODS28]|uniref:STAS domain-containing protein n=1 Tax=Streptomyces sp. ODS28 TaxID=3136688 RepID=UPI0031E8F64A
MDFLGHPLRIEPVRDPWGLRLSGDVDVRSVGFLARAIEELLAADTAGNPVLDLSELSFMDVAGLRLLISTAQRLGPERTLTIRGMAPHLRRILALVDWDTTPGLVLASSPVPANSSGEHARSQRRR